MSDAIAMIRACYFHQWPQDYGRPEIPVEAVRENVQTAEEIPPGANQGGYLHEERA